MSGEGRTATEPGGTVLVVDDEASGRALLRDILEPVGHIVIERDSGSLALSYLEDPLNPVPDAILMDILMPGIDGVEACRVIRANPRAAHVPVIVITSLNKRADRLRAIRAGANDHLSKPIDSDEVILKVHNAVLLKHLFDTVANDLVELRELQSLRDSLIQMIVHDMRQPVTALFGFLQVLQTREVEETSNKYVNRCVGIVYRLSSLVDSVLDIQKMESGAVVLRRSQADMAAFTVSVVDEFAQSPSKRVQILAKTSGHPIVAEFDTDFMKRVLYNLIDNAIKNTSNGGNVVVSVEPKDAFVRVAVVDNGPGIAREYQSMIFEKYAQVKMNVDGARPSWGIGLSFCKMAVTAHGGRIGVDSEIGNGSTFWFELPTIAGSKG